MRRNEVQPGTGEWLRFYRERAGLTQRQLASAAGVSYVTVNHLENDRRAASDRVARLLSKALTAELPKQLKVKPEDLFPENDLPTPTEIVLDFLAAYQERRKRG